VFVELVDAAQDRAVEVTEVGWAVGEAVGFLVVPVVAETTPINAVASKNPF
jgi:hypothetical protein